jgi:hypothetical protein
MTSELDSWECLWNARVSAIESVLGKTDGMVGHATIPFDAGFDLGGAADILYFRNFVSGVVSVTSELIGCEDQILSTLGNYELAICHRNDDPWGTGLISKLAYYTFDVALNPGETMDIRSAVPASSSISALLFLELARFEVLGKNAGILLCIGITDAELSMCRSGQYIQVENLMRENGIYPYTDLYRESLTFNQSNSG